MDCFRCGGVVDVCCVIDVDIFGGGGGGGGGILIEDVDVAAVDDKYDVVGVNGGGVVEYFSFLVLIFADASNFIVSLAFCIKWSANTSVIDGVICIIAEEDDDNVAVVITSAVPPATTDDDNDECVIDDVVSGDLSFCERLTFFFFSFLSFLSNVSLNLRFVFVAAVSETL